MVNQQNSLDGNGIDERALVAAYEAALTIASELDFESVLQRIVDLARALVDAKYGALSVTDLNGKITLFITSGLTPDERNRIGPLPEGHGLLGELAKRRLPLLIPDMSLDSRSVGFPPDHPPMTSLLGVPVLLAHRTVGNLYLSDRIDGKPFTRADLDVVQVLANHAAAAVDRSTLYRQVEQGRSAAEEQRDQLRSILDNLPTAVSIVSNQDGQVELANSGALEALIGPGAPAGTLPTYERDYRFEREDGQPLPLPSTPSARALKGDVIRNQQLIVRRRDGNAIPVLVQAGPLRDAAGIINRAVVVIQDITRLREAEQLKDDFISLVSHELRTPITAIYGGAHLLQQQEAQIEPKTRREILSDIVSESDRLNQMLENLISLSLIQAGRMEPDTEPVLLEPVANAVARQVAPHAPDHELVVAIDPTTPPVEADPQQLSQILRNLYENAVKYSPDGGQVTTSAEFDSASVTLHVTDQGLGIEKEHVADLFERFRRPGAPPTVRGMGLGLYLCRHLVEAQGGLIDAASPGPGKGSVFSVTLPIARGWHVESNGELGG